MKCTNCKTIINLEELQKLNRQIPLKDRLNIPTNCLICPSCNGTTFESEHVDHNFRVEVEHN